MIQVSYNAPANIDFPEIIKTIDNLNSLRELARETGGQSLCCWKREFIIDYKLYSKLPNRQINRAVTVLCFLVGLCSVAWQEGNARPNNGPII